MSPEKVNCPTRYLVLNADDFGYSKQVNSAVIRAHQHGTLTSASLMVAEEAWRDAVELAVAAPTLGVGLHVVVTNDRPLLTSEKIPQLVGANGKFGSEPFSVGVRYAFSRNCSRQLLLEMEAQFARFAEIGLPWSHADGHQHFHLHPVVWRHFIDLCDLYGVTRVRLPQEGLRAHFRAGGDRSGLNAMALLAFRVLGKKARRDLEQRGRLKGKSYFTCDRVYGLMQSGNMNSAYIHNLLSRVEGETIEIYFHPETPHARLLPVPDLATGARDVELSALLDPNLPDYMQSLGFRPGSYPEVESKMTESKALITTSQSI